MKMPEGPMLWVVGGLAMAELITLVIGVGALLVLNLVLAVAWSVRARAKR